MAAVLLSRRSMLRAIGAIAGALALSACGRRDGEGGAPAPGAPRRVVSLSPSTTEAVFAIGAGATLVGRSRYCDYPPEAAGLRAVGGYSDPNIEAILALAPTLVIGARGPAGPALEESLRAHNIATYFPETESIAQIESMLSELGQKLGAEAGAARAVAHLRDRRRAIEEAVRSRPRVRVAILFDISPIFAAGPGGFPDELLRIAGGENVIARGGPYPTIGIEHLIALDPEVLIDGAAEMAEGAQPASRLLSLRDAPGWRELAAMRAGRVRSLPNAAALRPGPRIGEGLVALARAIHGPDLAIAEASP